MSKNIRYIPISESAIMIEFGQSINPQQNLKITQLAEKIVEHPFPGFIECVPAYTTLTVYYNPIRLSMTIPQLFQLMDKYLKRLTTNVSKTKHVKIPVCYDEEFGPDLKTVASHTGLSCHQVIELHTKPCYHVYFLGFSPGFPFLGGMDNRLTTPRKQTPRLKIEAGSVGIAGKQTGVYPSETPGGWQIIGRTPISLLQINRANPTRLKPGDQVTFYAITKEMFQQIKQEDLEWE